MWLTIPPDNGSLRALLTHSFRGLHLGEGAVTQPPRIYFLWWFTLWNQTRTKQQMMFCQICGSSCSYHDSSEHTQPVSSAAVEVQVNSIRIQGYPLSPNMIISSMLSKREGQAKAVCFAQVLVMELLLVGLCKLNRTRAGWFHVIIFIHTRNKLEMMQLVQVDYMDCMDRQHNSECLPRRTSAMGWKWQITRRVLNIMHTGPRICPFSHVHDQQQSFVKGTIAFQGAEIQSSVPTNKVHFIHKTKKQSRSSCQKSFQNCNWSVFFFPIFFLPHITQIIETNNRYQQKMLCSVLVLENVCPHENVRAAHLRKKSCIFVHVSDKRFEENSVLDNTHKKQFNTNNDFKRVKNDSFWHASFVSSAFKFCYSLLFPIRLPFLFYPPMTHLKTNLDLITSTILQVVKMDTRH